MLESYPFKYKDELVGIISYDRSTDKYSFELNKDFKGLLPLTMFGMPPQDRDRIVQSQDILDFIKRRIFPANRQNINAHMKIAGLTEYHPWDIFISNLGVHMSDFFWVETGEADWKEFHPRLRALELRAKERVEEENEKTKEMNLFK